MLVARDGMDYWNKRMKKSVCNANFDTIELSSVNVGTSSTIDYIMYNDEGDNEPGPNHTIKLVDIYSNIHTDQEMTHQLQNHIQHFFVAKDKSQFGKLEKFCKFMK
jgi:hypothetical protein